MSCSCCSSCTRPQPCAPGKCELVPLRCRALKPPSLSVVVGRARGGALHGRTMDWQMPYLRALTIELEWRRAGATVARATSWAGYIGLLTGTCAGQLYVSYILRGLACRCCVDAMYTDIQPFHAASAVGRCPSTSAPLSAAAGPITSSASLQARPGSARAARSCVLVLSWRCPGARARVL